MFIRRILFAYLTAFCLFMVFSSFALAAFGTDTMVGYWKFDETTQGSNATDSSGGGFTGTPFGTGGGPSINTDVPTTSFPDARSATFNGGDQYFDMGTSSSLYSTTFSAAAWFYPTEYSNGYTRIFQQRGTTGGGGFDIEFDSGDAGCGDKQIYGVVWNSSGIATRVCMSSGTISLNTWNHVVFTYSGGTLTLYVNATDGASDGTATATLAAPNSYKFCVGRSCDGGTNYFKGSIDELRFYNRVLSTTEITALASGNHTSATWDGSSSTNTETAANWDINAIPDPYTNLTIADVANQPVLTANLAAAALTVSSGATIDLSSYNLTINDSGSFSNSGTLYLQGGNTITSVTNDTDSGTIEYNGSGTYSSGLAFGDSYYSLSFNGSGSWTLDANLDINQDLTLASGTLIGSSYTITLADDWVAQSGAFTANTSTVTLDGGDGQLISGSTTFNNLTKTVSAAATLTFEAGATQTIAGTLTLNGAASNLLSLRSSTSGTQWKIDPQGTRDITYVDVQDSNNTNATAIAYSSTNTYGSNLTNWTTSAPTPTPMPTSTPTPTPSSSNSSSSSSNSSSAPSCSATAPSGTPNLYQIDPSQNSVTLYFTPVSGVDSYYVSYGTNSSANQFGTSFSSSESSGALAYTVGSLQNGTTYYFQVRGGKGCATGNWSNTTSSTTLGTFVTSNSFNAAVNTTKKTVAHVVNPPKKAKIISSNLTAGKSNVCSYTVESGDSLWSIAQDKLGAGNKFTVLKDLNHVAGGLHPGDVLKLPCDTSEQTIAKAEKEVKQTGVTVDVKVLAVNNQPVVGATVTLHSKVRVAKTNKEGVAHFENVESGEHKVLLAYNGYTGSQNLKVDGKKKQQTLTLQVQLQGLAYPLVIGIISVMSVIILALLSIIFLLLKKRKTKTYSKSPHKYSQVHI